jgi:hypothetical protein
MAKVCTKSLRGLLGPELVVNDSYNVDLQCRIRQELRISKMVKLKKWRVE